MKTLRYALLMTLLLLPLAVFAQDDISTELDAASVLEAVRAEYGNEVIIIKAELETEDDDSDDSDDMVDMVEAGCWEVYIINPDETATETILELLLCLDESTSEIVITFDEDDSTDDMSDDMDDEDDLDVSSTLPTLSLDEAIASALEVYPDGVISSIELELEDGILIWDIDLEDDSRSVDINAETGVVVEFGYEDDDSDDNRDNDDDDNRDDDDDRNDNRDDDDDDDHNDDNDDDDDDDRNDDNDDDDDDNDDDD